jgi:predicted AlkP superfamily pyrophosphatase or phosphodiesterase
MCPSLWNLSHSAFFARIAPLFAYSGIKDCIDTSVSINTHKMWNDHIFTGFEQRNKSHHKMLKSFLKFSDTVSPNDDLNKALRYVFFKATGVKYSTPHLIPASLLDSFPVPKSKSKWKNLYELLRDSNIRFLIKEPKLGILEPKLLEGIPSLFKRTDMVFVKLNSLDRLGHKYGPLSKEVKRRITYLDSLTDILLRRIDDDIYFIIMSEHGMVPVAQTFDIIHFLGERGYELGQHYIGFFGATYTSFWFRNAKYHDAILRDLESVHVGKILTTDDKKLLGIDKIGWEYGEEIFICRERCVFFPEFYHLREVPKGMHGYAFGTYDAPIFILGGAHAETNRSVRLINFIDIMPTILQLLNIPVPPWAEGRQLIS